MASGLITYLQERLGDLIKKTSLMPLIQPFHNLRLQYLLIPFFSLDFALSYIRAIGERLLNKEQPSQGKEL